MMQVAVYGRLGADPKPIKTKTGKAMTAASMAIELSDRNGESATEWLGVVAFGRVAETLLRHARGDLVSVAGRVQLNAFKTKGGESRRELQIIADSVISAKSVRPGGGKKRPSGPPKETHEIEFNDDILF